MTGRSSATRSASAISASPKGANASLIYYSMQTLLVLYMVNYLLVPGRMEKVFGLQWLQAHVYHGISGQPLASAIFGTYTALVYLTPIFGGVIADRWLGRHRTLIVGGVLMAIEPAFLLALLDLLLGVGA